LSNTVVELYIFCLVKHFLHNETFSRKAVELAMKMTRNEGNYIDT